MSNRWLLVFCVALIFSALCAADEISLIRIGQSWRSFKGLSEPSDSSSAWRQIVFDDTQWESGISGFSGSFGGGATVFTDMPGRYSSVYLRKEFTVLQPDTVKWLTLRIDYNDGFIGFLNGHEVVRRNMPGEAGDSVPTNAFALSVHWLAQTEEIDLTAFAPLLVEGENVFAIQAHNASLFDFDFAVVPELLANFVRGPFVQGASTNSINVIWKTPVHATSIINYGKTPSLGEMAMSSNMVTNHVARLDGLEPTTLYYYQVASSADGKTARSPVQTFSTFAMSGPLTFAVIGDTGTGLRAQHEIATVIRNAQPDLVLHAGDVVYPSFLDVLADARCLSVYGEHMRNVPYFFCLGNHDLYSTHASYLRTFHLPTNNVPLQVHLAENTSPEHYYSFDHGDAHFSVLLIPYLDQYELKFGDPQYLWLKADLEASQKPWKFLLFHHPMMTSSLHRNDDKNGNGLLDAREVLDVVLPLARQNGVQMVFTGHDHVFERSNPIDGVYSIVTGAGGSSLYPLIELDRASAQHWIRHHAVKVTVGGDSLTLEALDKKGAVFDSMTINRSLSNEQLYLSAWHSPTIESRASNDSDGNIVSQSFDFTGTPIPALAGQFSNLGRAYVNNDRIHLYVGIRESLIYSDNNIFLFIETPGLPGVTGMAEMGNGVVDPEGEGADGLDFLANLSFSDFEPAIGCILGDEFADAQARSFERDTLSMNIGQGVFRLDRQIQDVPGVRFQQFNRSPQQNGVPNEQNANFIEIAIPYEELGGLQPGDTIRIGAVVAGATFDVNPTEQSRQLDVGFLGSSFTGNGMEPGVLRGISVQLATDPDTDHDGLSNIDEDRFGTNPQIADTDQDGLLDGWEISNQLNALVTDGEDGGEGDPDRDLFSNISEQAAGTDPQDSASNLRLEINSLGGGRFQVSWSAVAGKKYHLEVSDSPFKPFVEIDSPDFPFTATSSFHSFEEDFSGLLNASRYYRMVIVP